MRHTRLGASGLEVSRICIGCMSFGDASRGNQPWALGEDDSRAVIRHALEIGVNFFDTANVYSLGTSEAYLGRALRDFARREDVVVATKVNHRMRPGPNGMGLSRKAIMHEIDQSLRRLGTDYIDLYQIHRFDPQVPVAETMEALHDVVKAGKARYLGASAMWAWQFAKAQAVADRNGWTRFVSMQNHYNVLYREEEREMIPLCLDQGVATIPFSPLARGRLTRDWGATTARSEVDVYGRGLYATADRRIVEAVAEIAAARAAERAEIALAWLLAKPVVAAPVVGVSQTRHIDTAVRALDLVLTDDEVTALERTYTPQPVQGHS